MTKERIKHRSEATNIFQFFTMQERKHPFQLVKHWDEVSDKKRPDYPLFGEVKKDGVFAAVCIIGHTATIFGRTGKRLSNVHLNEQDFFQVVLEGSMAEFPQGVFIAELCCDKCSLEVLSGIVNPNRTKPLSEEQEALLEHIHLYFHDHLTVFEFISGKTPVPYAERRKRLANIVPQRLIIPTYLIQNEQDKEEFAKMCIDADEEGAVFKSPLADYEAGHKGWRSMKVVRGVSYDLECIGVEEGKGKYKGKVANLLFRYKGGNTIKAMLGKGYTHEDARNMWLLPGAYSPIGEIFEVYALQESSTGKALRLPKVGERRHDKVEPDF